MYLFVPFGLMMVIGIVLLMMYFTSKDGSRWCNDCVSGWGAAFVIIGGIFVLIVVGCTMGAHSGDRGAGPKHARIMEVRGIHVSQSDDLLKKFAAQVSSYAKHEKDIFGKISPEQVDFYWVKYPELRQIEAVKMNFIQIKELRKLIYEQDIKVAKLKQTVRFRRINPWIITWFLGDVPAWAE